VMAAMGALKGPSVGLEYRDDLLAIHICMIDQYWSTCAVLRANDARGRWSTANSVAPLASRRCPDQQAG
jgi:hypothetical protein